MQRTAQTMVVREHQSGVVLGRRQQVHAVPKCTEDGLLSMMMKSLFGVHGWGACGDVQVSLFLHRSWTDRHISGWPGVGILQWLDMMDSREERL